MHGIRGLDKRARLSISLSVSAGDPLSASTSSSTSESESVTASSSSSDSSSSSSSSASSSASESSSSSSTSVSSSSSSSVTSSDSSSVPASSTSAAPEPSHTTAPNTQPSSPATTTNAATTTAPPQTSSSSSSVQYSTTIVTTMDGHLTTLHAAPTALSESPSISSSKRTTIVLASTFSAILVFLALFSFIYLYRRHQHKEFTFVENLLSKRRQARGRAMLLEGEEWDDDDHTTDPGGTRGGGSALGGRSSRGTLTSGIEMGESTHRADGSVERFGLMTAPRTPMAQQYFDDPFAAGPMRFPSGRPAPSPQGISAQTSESSTDTRQNSSSSFSIPLLPPHNSESGSIFHEGNLDTDVDVDTMNRFLDGNGGEHLGIGGAGVSTPSLGPQHVRNWHGSQSELISPPVSPKAQPKNWLDRSPVKR